jgi:hypothetical protein
MHLFDRKTTALLIVAVFCWLRTAGAGPPADKAGTGANTGVEARIETFTAEQKAHWSYQPLKRPELPAVRKLRWVCNPIDRFVLAELESAELPHAPEADRIALIRRLTYDLTGLPPRPDEVAAFLADQRPDAYERQVDRLLESPRYGERWAQHWLDLAHYADSNGFELDAERPDSWRYRDWVVRALNADLPYDRFVALQIAGDEITPGDHEALIATGFGRCGPREIVGGNVIPEVKRQNELTEITGTVGSVFLGLTIGCARCHDHKFDAIPTTDFYRFQSFFAASELVDLPIAGKAEIEAFEAAKKAIEQKIAPLRAQLAALEAPYRKRLAEQKHALLTADERAVTAIPEPKRSPEQKRLVQGVQNSLRVTWEDVAAAVAANRADHGKREALKKTIAEIERTLPRPPAHAMALADQHKKVPDTFVFRRGDYRNKGPKVSPRPLGVVLASQQRDAFGPDWIVPASATTGRRAALARWLTGAENPLTARVIANRLWQYHFTRGIVATSSDLGVRGEPPSHPELLDWLAAELISVGWRLKPMHRLIVTSATYRQSSKPIAKLAEQDSDNTLLGRMNRRRLDAEGIRDAMLAVSGELNPKMGGRGVLAPLEKEVVDLIFTEAEVVDLWPEDRDPSEHLRRSLYLFRKRNVRYPLLESFDSPDTQFPCPRRETSTHALQALNLLNSDFAFGRARALAGRILREAGPGQDERIGRAYQVVLCRQPSPSELDRARKFLASQAEMIRGQAKAGRTPSKPTGLMDRPLDPAEGAAWVDFALAMLNCNEFLYVP